MLFDKRHKQKIKAVWYIICILIILSMVLLYTPISQ